MSDPILDFGQVVLKVDLTNKRLQISADGGRTWNDSTAAVSISPGDVGPDELAEGAVTESKLGAGSVTELKLGAGSVTETKLGNGAVTARTLAPDAWTKVPAPTQRYTALSVEAGMIGSTVGSGTATRRGYGGNVATGTTSGSAAYFLTDNIHSKGIPGYYDRDLAFAFDLVRIGGTSSVQQKLRVGASYVSLASNTEKGVGWRIEGNSLYAWNADGAAETTTLVPGVTLTDWNSLYVEMTSGVDIRFYVNGTLVATHNTHLPSGDQTYLWGIRVDNGTDTSASNSFGFTAPMLRY